MWANSWQLHPHHELDKQFQNLLQHRIDIFRES
jgi:hypothetical protein